MSRRRIILSLSVIGLLAVAVAMAAATARPAQAVPSYKSVCSSCHSSPPVGSVTATPSNTSLAPGEAYSVRVVVTLSSSGNSGFWIVSNDAATPDPNLAGGPGSSPMTASLSAPTALGTYTYKVYGVKGTPGAGQTGTTTYSITVASAPTPTPTPTATPTPTPTATPTPTPTPTATPPADTTSPTTRAPQAAHVRAGHRATLKYRVNDLGTGHGKAAVTIVIRTRSGEIVRTLRAGTVRVNRSQSLHFRATLKRGSYVFTVMATDAAGNASTVNGSNRLIVTRGSRDHDHGHDD